MLLNIYIGALIFGGVLLVASILLGGHGDVDADIDGDLELGVEGPDVDVDAATDVEVLKRISIQQLHEFSREVLA